MSKAVKGLLLSGLVLPGLGQMVLKKYLRGLAFMGAALGGMVAIVAWAVRAALEILNAGEVDINQITLSVDQVMADISSPLAQAACILILAAWIGSAVDAYLIGRQMDRQFGAVSTESESNRG